MTKRQKDEMTKRQRDKKTKRQKYKKTKIQNKTGDERVGAYLIFVIFSPQALFLAKIFSTQKRVNRNKPILRQNSVNRQKKHKFGNKTV